jgi:hypothetical protein
MLDRRDEILVPLFIAVQLEIRTQMDQQAGHQLHDIFIKKWARAQDNSTFSICT